MSSPANWYPDPLGRHQYRWYDGSAWTGTVSDNGVQGSDPLAPPPPPVATPQPPLAQQPPQAQQPQAGYAPPAQPGYAPPAQPQQPQQAQPGYGPQGQPAAGFAGDARVAQQVQDRAGVQQVAFQGGGSIFNEPVLVVNQKAKIIEVTNQYAVFDAAGRQLAAVNQVGQSTAKKALRVLTSLDQFLTTKLDITDAAGAVVLRLTRPGKVFKSTIIVSDGHDTEIGRIVQDNVFGKIHFTLQAGGHTYGSIRAENWRAWNFRIEDHTGTEVARITKTWEGLAKTLFTTADNYVVQFHQQLAQPLLQLVVASALSVDTALKQDSRGLG